MVFKGKNKFRIIKHFRFNYCLFIYSLITKYFPNIAFWVNTCFDFNLTSLALKIIVFHFNLLIPNRSLTRKRPSTTVRYYANAGIDFEY